jgi:HD-GYP domain-containing protein (c-di-GMP phosphodiesterase class II)
MHSYPDVSEFVAYLGWNVGFLFLFLAVFFSRHEESRNYFHPIMLLPILINVPQFILYISYGGVLNNIWEVGLTTITIVLCLQELAYYWKNRQDIKRFPWFFLFVLLYLATYYGMWTSSCFDWPGEPLNPYFYCSNFGSLLRVLIVYGAGKQFDNERDTDEAKNASELRVQIVIQSVISIVIIVICALGYFVAFLIKNTLPEQNGVIKDESQLVILLFVISAILILIILALVYFLASHYRQLLDKSRKIDEGKRSRIVFAFTIIITLALMAFAVIYNNAVLYNVSIISVYEDGDEAIKSTATELENYLTVASTTLRVTADTVDLMEKNGNSLDQIYKYLVDQTNITSKQFDENFTGIYAYINGEYLDGLEWIPPEDYEPTSRDWYKTAVEAKGEIVIVSPYVDAQTGSVVITIAKCISDDNTGNNVVALDVIVNHINEVTKAIDIAGKGYGMVVNDDGFIIAHKDDEFDGKNLTDIYDQDLLDRINKTNNGRINATLDEDNCTLFIAPVMDQWHSLIVVSDSELFENTYSPLAINGMVSFITFCLILFFYYIGYKNEQIYGKRVEEMNIQVVTALATAIDAKDKYTNGHSSRVAEYARMIAAHSGYSKSEQDEIYMIGLLHDVGKIGIPDEVINKPSRLTDEEFELIKKHPVIGNMILSSIKERPKLAIGARWHHERYGGGGYPDGIAGDKIPEEARIIAVADAYDAMTSRRSYREVMPQEKVLDEIRKGSGTQFDPKYANVMIELIENDKDYQMREK